jgi:hypothetical protein
MLHFLNLFKLDQFSFFKRLTQTKVHSFDSDSESKWFEWSQESDSDDDFTFDDEDFTFDEEDFPVEFDDDDFSYTYKYTYTYTYKDSR